MRWKYIFAFPVIIFMFVIFCTTALASPQTYLAYASPTSGNLLASRVILKWRIISWSPIEKVIIKINGLPIDQPATASNIYDRVFSFEGGDGKNKEFRPPDIKPGFKYFWSLYCKTSENEISSFLFEFETK